MKMMKKITAAALAAGLMGTIAVTANAADEIGLYATPIELGEKVSDTIPYDESGSLSHYKDGKNYKDYQITIPKDGTLVIVYDANIGCSKICLYRKDTKVAMNNAITSTIIGKRDWKLEQLEWNPNVGKYTGTIQYEVVKGDHFIRVGRAYEYLRGWGELGNGTFNLTAYMKKPGDTNHDGKVSAADATAVLKDAVGIEKLSGIAAANADMNDDGKINAADATAILKSVVGLS